MEINFPPRLLPCPQYLSCGISVKHPLLTEHINVVNGEEALLAVALEGGDLVVDDVLGSCFRGTTSIVLQHTLHVTMDTSVAMVTHVTMDTYLPWHSMCSTVSGGDSEGGGLLSCL